MKKGAIAVDIPIELIALVFSFAVIVALFIPPIYNWITESTEKTICEWSIVAGAIARPLGKSLINPECKARKINVTINDLEKYIGEAETKIQNWLEDKKYSRIWQEYPEANKNNEYKYAINKIVSEEITNCWEKVLQGKLPMFDKWYNKVDIFGSDYEKYAEDYVNHVDAFVRIWGAPTFCIVCSNIKFEDELKQANLPQEISLTKWLQNTPYDKKPTRSIYEFLYEGQTKPNNLAQIEYNYEVNPPNRYSVIYKRINPHFFDDVIANAWNLIDYLNPFVDESNNIPQTIHELKLVPHDMVAKPQNQGGESCLYIIE